MITAALATIPSRAHTLPAVLHSLRPQVDRLCVWLNGFTTPPEIVMQLADRWTADPTNGRLDCGKFAWADQFEGLYLACDDDLFYPPDYAVTMRDHVARWNGGCLVTLAGRRYKGVPEGWEDVVARWRWNQNVSTGKWANYAITPFLAFDTRLGIPPNLAGMDGDAAIAVWAQERHVPIWVAPHRRTWVRYLLPADAPTLWQTHKADGFTRRDAFVTSRFWKLHLPPNYRDA